MKFRGTTVTFLKRSDGAIIGYSASGHSGYADEGYDIVCAAISALTQTIQNGIVNVLKVPAMYDQDDENAFIETVMTPEATEEDIEKAQVLFVTLVEGLQAIQRGYPRNLQIIFKERR